MDIDFNNRVRQVYFLLFVTLIGIIIFLELYIFFPGFLGAVTLYILSRKWYFKLTVGRKWKKGLTALLFILAFVICVAAPVYLSFQLLYNKLNILFKDPQQIEAFAKSVSSQIQQWTGQELVTKDLTGNIQKSLTTFVPRLLNSSATIMGNFFMILFLAFFMFVNGVEMEKTLQEYIPLRQQNIDRLADETNMMVRASAIGIPVISIIQGLCAAVGYWIFGVKDVVLLGFMTGIFAFFPVVGTAVIWLPLVIFLFSSGESGKAIGLAIYSVVVTGNIDYVARITLLKKIGDIHPITTILGLIVGLKLFGFWGFIFGPLLISYFLLLIRIYRSEFGPTKAA
ncbi:AI-2E family transporter [Dyadobacter sandarakinus]|uniref:AI-2E family transporter n=1 Tax=Dyadobacter sandarakinus TaxID=2747268 RepID=A0ABX7I3M8_9BACT|nr:AI-2E family transporter [Dyadobacter sandarakinus]QRR00545.1 AI-2E family transporter [Dyadobacter sandarakinus]